MSRQAGHLGQVGVIVADLPVGQRPGRYGQKDYQDPLNHAGPAFADIAQKQRPLPIGVANIRAATEAKADAGKDALETGHAPEQRQFALGQQFGDRAGEVPAAEVRV